MKLAAVDIGSNAARLQISNVLVTDNDKIYFKKIEYVRFALRLGHDVFTIKRISPEREDNLCKLLHAYKLLMDLHQVTDYAVCATSAMREAQNAPEIIDRIQKKIGIKIMVIDGSKEAEMINRAIIHVLDEKSYIHIDVGGGSTELNLYTKRSKVAAKSFKIGSVRHLEHSESPQTWNRMKEWIEEQLPMVPPPLTAIGTGGNINKIFELASPKSRKYISAADVANIRAHVASFSLSDRINKLRLNPDRADVIIPAADIYLSVMKWAKTEKIIVPDVGLKDGIIQMLYDRSSKKRINTTSL